MKGAAGQEEKLGTSANCIQQTFTEWQAHWLSFVIMTVTQVWSLLSQSFQSEMEEPEKTQAIMLRCALKEATMGAHTRAPDRFGRAMKASKTKNC